MLIIVYLNTRLYLSLVENFSKLEYEYLAYISFHSVRCLGLRAFFVLGAVRQRWKNEGKKKCVQPIANQTWHWYGVRKQDAVKRKEWTMRVKMEKALTELLSFHSFYSSVFALLFPVFRFNDSMSGKLTLIPSETFYERVPRILFFSFLLSQLFAFDVYHKLPLYSVEWGCVTNI